ncbi:MAG: hypothetical protein A3C90_03630 [Candidatus Magasanikbacteria bacterium RIFCSPHIGHO2_02_FULL_51_14]|uniref:AtpZ/AtpI family protein n=1 Tax=Candidatus Magasanikbacteria bacterium RIFCSPHIGHO2_02_FULL_51_14 TaxID=1798683 RepID=A0A1F6MEL9_9BACT|nr:MAG: hypothetical protein A3C90_03630 [Candidatus Magasanikbacteria bacterium RIFCSPHIGHO2_02_FULL_51_14]
MDPKDRKYYLFALKIAGDFGITIAIPVVVFVLIGQWLDGKYGTRPWLTILAFVLAAVLTARIIVKKARAYGKEYEQIGRDRKQ